ncbi:type 1 phosphatases regulator ypi1, partial [Ananas comosus]|uniref:Type 1 phosphatases regulator ypi1 n=1 Tax=Ananas comosus TaxID=4615 RepID=A0A6P5GFX5_ANACO
NINRSPSHCDPSPSPPTSTLTLTLEEPSSSSSSSPSSAQPPQTLVLRLKRPKKKVSWKEGTVDNEFLNRKSSKKCCIFHKELPFDDDCSDDAVRAGVAPTAEATDSDPRSRPRSLLGSIFCR